MRRITEFRRICRSYDSIKLAILLILCALFFTARAVTGLLSYFSVLSKPLEYVVSSSYSSTASSKIKELPNFVVISSQSTAVATLGVGKDAIPVSVRMLSAEYLYKGYGEYGAENTVYLSKADYSRLTEKYKNGRISYTDSTGLYKSMRIAFCESMQLSAGEAVVSAVSAVLNTDCSQIRVMFSKTDITGITLKKLQGLGFTVENYDLINESNHRQSLVFLELKYAFITVLLSSALSAVLIKTTLERHRESL